MSRIALKNPFNFFICLIGLGLASCGTPEAPPYPLPDEAHALLTGGEVKTWKLARRLNNGTRMNMGDCFLSYRASYRSDQTMHDNSGDHRDCGPTLKANWNFAKGATGHYYIQLTSEQLPALMNIEKDHKLFKIKHLSEEQLVLTYSHRQFSDKATLITDVYVPENVSIEGRDFHW